MLDRIAKAYVGIATKMYIPMAILVIAATWFAFPRAVAIFKNIQTDFKLLLPEGYESVKQLDELQRIFGSQKNLSLVLETDDGDSLKEVIPQLAGFLEADGAVKEVNWRKPAYDFFDRHKLFYPAAEDLEDLRDRIDRRIQREKLGDLYISFEDDEDEKDTFGDLKDKYASKYTGKITSEFYTNEDETVFLMAIYPKGEKLDVAEFKKFANHIKARLSEFDLRHYDPTVRVHYTGGVITSTHEYGSLVRDLKTAGTVSAALILLLILVYFRNIRAVLFVSAPLGCGLIWNFAIAYRAIGHLNMTTAFLFSILFGLGIDFGIHLNSRYNEERSGGKDLEGALTITLSQTGRSSFTAAATTAAAFIVLIINDFKGFSEFGFIAGAGILVTLAAYIIILPFMLTLEERIGFIRRRRFVLTGWKLEHIAELPQRPMIIGLACAVAVSIALSAALLRFDYDFKNFRAPSAELERAQELEHTVNPQRAIPSAVLAHSREEADIVKRAIEKRFKRNPNTLIDSTRNVYSLVPDDQDKKIPTMRKIKELLEDDIVDKLVKGKDKDKIDSLKASAAANPFDFEDVPPAIKRVFIDEDTGDANQLVYIFLHSDVDLKDGRKAIALAEEIRDIPAENGKTYHAASSSIVFADVLTVMLKDSPKAIAISFAAVLLLLIIDFKNIKHVAVTMLPLVSGVILMLGIMSAVGMDLNFFNMIVLPVMLGIGIDNGVHFFHRYQEEGYQNLRKVMTTTGGSIVMTTLTTAAGFAGMTLAHHGGLASIGIAANIGMMTCLITTMFFFPAVLARIWGR